MTIYRQTVEIQIHFSYTMFEAEGRNIQIEIKIDNSCKETKVSEIWKTDDQWILHQTAMILRGDLKSTIQLPTITKIYLCKMWDTRFQKNNEGGSAFVRKRKKRAAERHAFSQEKKRRKEEKKITGRG